MWHERVQLGTVACVWYIFFFFCWSKWSINWHCNISMKMCGISEIFLEVTKWKFRTIYFILELLCMLLLCTTNKICKKYQNSIFCFRHDVSYIKNINIFHECIMLARDFGNIKQLSSYSWYQHIKWILIYWRNDQTLRFCTENM